MCCDAHIVVAEFYTQMLGYLAIAGTLTTGAQLIQVISCG